MLKAYTFIWIVRESCYTVTQIRVYEVALKTEYFSVYEVIYINYLSYHPKLYSFNNRFVK
jgi:hypothetical protein